MSEKEKLLIEINEKIEFIEQEIEKKKLILNKLKDELKELNNNWYSLGYIFLLIKIFVNYIQIKILML